VAISQSWVTGESTADSLILRSAFFIISVFQILCPLWALGL